MVSRGFSEPSHGVGGSSSSGTAGLGHGPALAWVLLACSACVAAWSAFARNTAANAALGDFRAEPAVGTSQDRGSGATLAVHVAELRDQVTKVEEAWSHALALGRLEGGVPVRQASASASASAPSAAASDAPAASALRHGLARLSADKMDLEGLEEVMQRERSAGAEQCGWFMTSHCTPYGFVERSLCGAQVPPSASLAGFCVCPASAGGGGGGGGTGGGGDGDGVEYWGRSCAEQGGAQQPGKSVEARCEAVCSLGADGTALVRTGGLSKEAHARFLAAHRITPANVTAVDAASPTHAELTRRYPPRRQPSAMKRQATGGGGSGGRQQRRLWAGDDGAAGDAPEVAGVVVAVATPDRERALSQALRTFERSVNARLGYPYAVFFPRSESFSEDFKDMVLRAASSSVVFGHLPLYASAPAATNAVLRLLGVQPLEAPDVNAASDGYLAQRFFTATFFAHPLLQSYDYFIRLSPDADFLCDLYHDPLALLATHDKVYGFATTFTNTEEQARWAPPKKQPVVALARKEDATAAPATEAPQQPAATPGRLSVHSIAARYLVSRAWKRGLGADGRHRGQAAASQPAFDGKKFVRDLLETVAAGAPEQRLPAVIQAMDRFAAAAAAALRGSGEREAAPYAYAAAFFALVEDKGGDADGLLGEGAPFSSAFLSFVDPSVEDTAGSGGTNFTSSFYGDRNLRFCEFATGVEMGSLRFLRRANGYADFIAFLEETGQLTPEALRAHAFRSVGVALTAPLRALYLTEPLAFSQGGVLQFPADTSVCSHFPIPDRPAPDPQSDSLRCRALLSRLADPSV
eukprot:Rhum_TRINITY_DN13532_c2_g1::Rhum_TRINITY_DN13532_c2_g1_i1::g.61169::m.61169